MKERPLVLAVLPQLIPSTLIGVVKPLLALHRERRIDFDVTLEAWVGQNRLAAADVLVFCRNTEPRYGAVLETALQLRKPVIYELDDDFFVIPSGTPGSDYHRDPARLAQLERYLRCASLVRVYSRALLARVTALNPRVHRVDAPVDWTLVPAVPPLRSPGPLRIVYATSRPIDPMAAIFMTDLRGVLDAHRGHVEAWFWGYRPRELAGRADIHVVDFIQDYDAFFQRFAGFGFDIGLAPLPDQEFHRAKSDNKFREYAASRIAGIYSDMVVYRDCVEHGRTGLLVPDLSRSWFRAMTRLIEDDALRTHIKDEAWTEARRRYSVALVAHTWLAHIEAVLSSQEETARPAALATGGGGQADARIRRGTPALIWSVIRRTVEVLQGRPAPAVLGLAARTGWHLRSLRALRRLRRDLARSREAMSPPRTSR